MGMFKKEQKSSMSGNKAQGASIIGIAVYVMFAVVLVIALALFGYSWLDSGREQKSARELATAAAEDLAYQLDSRITAEVNVVKRLARSKLVKESLLDTDEKILKALQSSMASQLAFGGRVLIVPSGQLERLRMDGENNKYNLSFAGIGMISSAAKVGQTQVVEVHELNTPAMHAAVAIPVADKGDVVGVLFVTMPLKEFGTMLDKVARYGSDVAIQQVAGNKPVAIIESRPGEMPDVRDAVTMPVGSTILQVAAWPVVNDKISTPFELGLTVFGSAAILIIILIWIYARQITRLMNKDLGRVVTLAELLVEGGSIGKSKPELKAFDGTLSMLELLSSKRGAEPAAQVRPQAAATIASGSSSADVSDEFMEDPVPSMMTAFVSETLTIDDSIVGEYDIRGLVDSNFTNEVCYLLGQAIGTETYERGQQTVIVARDQRVSSRGLSQALIKGLRDSGRDVVDIGLAPSPVLYFATHFLDSDCGVMVTGSHNTEQYNGLKIVLSGDLIHGEDLKTLVARVANSDLVEGDGSYNEQSLIADYTARIAEDVQLGEPLNVVVDCGNGANSKVAPKVLEVLGCNVTPLYCDLSATDGHHADPANPENMADLVAAVKEQGADIGVAFDGDGDRLGVVDSAGNIIWADRVLMLLASDVISINPGTDILYDVKSSRNLAGHILSAGGRPIMWKSGHALLREKMRESGAMLAGEFSGHIFFRDRWYGFDDALYAAVRLLEIISMDGRRSADIFADIPNSPATPEYLIPVGDSDPHDVMKKLQEKAQFPGAKLITIDGIRAEFQEGWGLIRASNTQLALSCRFEADDVAGLDKIKDVFRHFIQQHMPDIELPF